MARITFNNKTTLVDQPSVATENKVTASDMNEIKSVVNANADATVPVELYNSSSGTTGSINNLADDVSNYKYLEIFYNYNGTRQSTKIIGNKASLIVHTTSNNQTYISFKEVTFSGTSMTVNSYQQWNNVWGTSNVNASNTNGIYVIRIVGYK
jgi:hypothetical protein